MSSVNLPAREVPVILKKDVVVVGGGPAGIVAAISAARQGASVVLIERYGFVGGNANMYLPLLSFLDSRGKQVIWGIPQEIIDRLKAVGGSSDHIRCPITIGFTLIDVEWFKDIVLRMLRENKVELLLHCLFTQPVLSKGQISSIIVESKSGPWAIEGEIFIDASGDAELAFRTGAPFRKGREKDGKMQPPTLMFTMGNVDTNKLRMSVANDPDTYTPDVAPPEYYATHEKYILVGLRGLVKKAAEQGHFTAPNERLCLTTMLRPGEMHVNVTRAVGIDGSDGRGLIQGEIETRGQIQNIVTFLKKYVPGFENSYLINTAHQIGIRETRRIVGDYTLTKEDIINSRRFEDAIAVAGYCIDIHNPGGEDSIFEYPSDSYDIPYRCLLPQGVSNLVVAGRSISATHEAMAATRVMVTCMAVGQAAGCAGALCSRENLPPREIDSRELRRLLREAGVYLG